MRYLIATAASVAILAATFFAHPWLRAHGWPSGGLLMIAVAALLAWVWLAITRRPAPRASGKEQGG